MPVTTSFRTYLWGWVRVAVAGAWEVFGIVATVAGLALWAWHKYRSASFTIAASWIGLSANDAMTDLVWQMPFAVGIFVLAFRFLRAPYEMHVAEATRHAGEVAALNARIDALPELRVQFDPNDEAMWWREERWCRIAVVNDSPVAMARNVKVRLTKMAPYLLRFKALPSRLGIKGEDNAKECSIVPKGTQLFDVFRWPSPEKIGNDCAVWIVEGAQGFELARGASCDLTIEVSADSVQPKSYRFRISRTTDGETTFLDVTS